MTGQPQASPDSNAPEEGGQDLEAQIQSGVESFVKSQDPAIAVEVVNMMAKMMGIAPDYDPYGESGEQAPDGDEGSMVPQQQSVAAAARMGRKIYRKGGKLW